MEREQSVGQKIIAVVYGALLIGGLFAVVTVFNGCARNDSEPTEKSRAGVSAIRATIATGEDGLTVEQRNVKARLEMDNKPGSIKHLYVISAYSGQCIIYSTVKGKVTSSGKRLSPYTLATGGQGNGGPWGTKVALNGQNHYTAEVLQDDGTYGSSAEYVYWFDQSGVYNQFYVTGGTILMVRSEPMPIKSVIINVETKEAK